LPGIGPEPGTACGDRPSARGRLARAGFVLAADGLRGEPIRALAYRARRLFIPIARHSPCRCAGTRLSSEFMPRRRGLGMSVADSA
jgi:hypothetical protein